MKITNVAPEHVPGGPFARAEWALQGAADMVRIDVNYGGITGCWKLINLGQLYGLKGELHGTAGPTFSSGAPPRRPPASTTSADCCGPVSTTRSRRRI